MIDVKSENYSGVEELLNSEVMKNYNYFIVSYALKNIKNLDQIIDFGAGIGTLSLIFKENFKIDPICVEIDKNNQQYLKDRNLKFYEDIEYIEQKVDLIFSSNVLEHIKDDLEILKLMKKKLNKNGKIYLYLPAKMLLWSKLDEIVGHYRRYEIKEIKNKCQQAGFKIKKLHYADSLGFFASLLVKFIGYDSKKGIGSASSLKFYDKWLFPISKFFDLIGFRFLFGKNLIIIAENFDD